MEDVLLFDRVERLNFGLFSLIYLSDYFFYIHEPHEEQHLFMSVYPYEVPIKYIQATHTQTGGESIIYKKEIARKITGKGGCQEIPIEKFVQCIKSQLVSTLKKSDIKCTIPALSYIDIDTSSLDYCNNTEDALAVNGLIYNSAQKVQVLFTTFFENS